MLAIFIIICNKKNKIYINNNYNYINKFNK